VFIELALVIFTQATYWWRILTILAFFIWIVLPVWLISDEPEVRFKMYLISSFFVATVPLSIIFQVGFVTTSVVYLWPIAAGYLAAIPAVYLMRFRRLPIAIPFLTLLPAIYAASMEVVAIFLVVVYIWAICAWWKRRGLHASNISMVVSVVSILAIAVCFLIYHLISPGNSVRLAAQGEHSWFDLSPDHSFWDFFEAGFSSTLRTVFTSGYILILFFFIAIALLNIALKRNLWYVAFSFVPIFGSLGLSSDHIRGTLSYGLSSLFAANRLLKFGDPRTFVVFGLLAALLVSAVIAIYGAFRWSRKFMLIITILAMGFASKMVVVPYLDWIRQDRTDLFLLAAFVLAALIAIERILTLYQNMPLHLGGANNTNTQG